MGEFAYPPIHVSGTREHQRCKRKWILGDRHWGYGYRPMPSNSSAAVGTLCHDGMKFYYGDHYAWPEAFAQACEKWIAHSKDVGAWDGVDDEWLRDTFFLSGRMLEGYGAHYAQAVGYLDDINLTFLETERKWSMQLGDLFTVEGIWDGIVRHNQSGQLWVFETKTTNNINRMVDGIQWDYQPKVYVAAAEQIYGEPIGGVIYNIVKRTDPFSVKILKNGMPSTAKAERESTTPSVYRGLVSAGLALIDNPSDRYAMRDKYEPLIAEMLEWPNPLYVRHAVTFSPTEINNVLRYMELEGNSMISTWGLGAKVQPSYDRYTCGGCTYRWVCQGIDAGHDWQEILDATMIRETEDFYGSEAYSPEDE